MIDPLLPLGDGHTLLSEDDRQCLKLRYITNRGELNEAEQANILRAVGRARPPSLQALLDDLYLRRLHKRMFGDVWRWAGEYRRVETNIGIDPNQIAVATRNLVGDTKAWIDGAMDDPDVMAARFHHRLVSIHPFPNGNGRHGRVAAGYLIVGLKRPNFTWGANSGLETEQVRAEYIAALHEADGDDVARLTAFARS